MPNKPFIILTGPPGAGKTTLTRQLCAEQGFDSRSVGDHLAEIYRDLYSMEPDEPINKLLLGDLHAVLNRQDPRRIVRYTLEDFYDSPTNGRVIDGMRNLSHVLNLVRDVGAYVVGLEAPLETRWARRRAELGEKAVYEAFISRQLKDADNPDPHAVQADRVMDLAVPPTGVRINADQPQQDVYNDVVAALVTSGHLGR